MFMNLKLFNGKICNIYLIYIYNIDDKDISGIKDKFFSKYILMYFSISYNLY